MVKKERVKCLNSKKDFIYHSIDFNYDYDLSKFLTYKEKLIHPIKVNIIRPRWQSRLNGKFFNLCRKVKAESKHKVKGTPS